MHIPDGWKLNDLGNLIKEQKKSSLKVSDAANFGEFRFFTSGETILKHTSKQLDGKNIFLATGGVANIKYYEGDAAYSTDTYAVTTKDEIDTEYLYFDLLNILYYINANYFQGSGLKHLQKKDLKKHQILFPENPTEQTTIARILSKVDEAIAQTEQLIAKYTRIKTGLMQDLLTKGIDEHGNIRSEQTHAFKDSPLGRIPKEWEVVRLIDIGSKDSPFLKTGPFGSSLKSEHWKETGVPVITIGSLGESNFIKENLLYVSSDKANELNTYKLNVGDILFSRVADIGRSLVIQSENDGWIMSSNFMRLRLNKEIFNPFILNLIIKHSEAFLKQVAQNVPEGGRSVTNSKILNSFIFPKIPMSEQVKVMVLYSKIDSQINSITNQLSKLQSLKTGLMQDLLSGKVRVNHLIKETASV
ncbi:MAG: restriction endonuclease subunit S [Saprospiraceae bacterium]|nr:restriction endonuclease subunit S [Saprospiraceae bacterium]